MQQKAHAITHVLVTICINYCNVLYMAMLLNTTWTSTGPEYRSMSLDWHASVCSCDISASQTALVTKCFQVLFKVLIIIYTALHCMAKGLVI